MTQQDIDLKVQEMKAAWRELCNRGLRVLVPRELTNEEFVALARGSDPTDPKFREALPIYLADWGDAALKTIRQYAEKQEKTIDGGSNWYVQKNIPTVGECLRDYDRDIVEIWSTLWGSKDANQLENWEKVWKLMEEEEYNDQTPTRFQMGHFTEPRERLLHSDLPKDLKEQTVVFVSRLFDLKTEYISGETQANFSEEQWEWLHSNAMVDMSASFYWDLSWTNLFDRPGTLQQMPLNSVAVISGGYAGDYPDKRYIMGTNLVQGLLHRSAAVPEDGTISAFFQTGSDAIKEAGDLLTKLSSREMASSPEPKHGPFGWLKQRVQQVLAR